MNGWRLQSCATTSESIGPQCATAKYPMNCLSCLNFFRIILLLVMASQPCVCYPIVHKGKTAYTIGGLSIVRVNPPFHPVFAPFRSSFVQLK